jgi:hypothetical protein
VAFPETARLAGSLYRRAAVCVLPSKNTSIIEVLRRPVESAQDAAVGVVHQGGGFVALVVPGPQAHVQRVQGQVGA